MRRPIRVQFGTRRPARLDAGAAPDANPATRGGRPVLALRPNCERCDVDLPPSSDAARICSFECTFCAACAATRLGETCPNCGGGFAPRPIRPAALLARYPAQTERVLRPHAACAA
jgi:hypothetical protein